MSKMVMIQENQKFKFSMIDGLMFDLTSGMIALYNENRDWLAVRKIAIFNNLPQKNALSSRDRYVSEVLSRVRFLTAEEIKYFAVASDQEQKYILWIALCRSNRLVREFALKLLRENFLNYKASVSLDDYDSFYFDLSSSNPELENVSVIMKNKLRGRIFSTAKEVGIITKDNFIQPAFVSGDFCKKISLNTPNDLLYLPIFEADLKRLLAL